MLTIPSSFIAASRYLLRPQFRIHRGAIEAHDCHGSTIITHPLHAEHPDIPFFQLRKWPSIDPGTLTIQGDTLRYKSRGIFQTTKTAPTEFPTDHALTLPSKQTLDLATAPSTITPDISQTLADLAPCMSTDETRYVLNGILCGENLVATDGRRLLMMASLYNGTEFIMPAAAVRMLVLLHAKKRAAFWRWKMCHTPDAKPHSVLIETDFFSLQFPVVDGNFPNYRQVIPNYSGEKIAVRCIPQEDSIAPMAAWLRTRDSCHLLPVSDGIMAYDAVSGSHATFPGYISSMCTFNGSFLHDFLRISGFIEFQALDRDSPAVCQYSRGLGVLMPMRGNNVDPADLQEIHYLATA